MRLDLAKIALIPVLCVVVVLAAATPVRGDDTLSRRERGDLAIKARAILKKHCFECHGGPESRGTIKVLDHSGMIANAPNPLPFVAPGKAATSLVIQFLEDGSMPPGDRTRPTNEDIKTLKEWVQATAPSYPFDFNDAATLDVMLRDLDNRPDDAPHLRYFSLAHLIREGAELPDLKKAESELYRSLTWCGVKPPPGKLAAEPVDDSATLFRFDVRHAGWDNRELFYRSPKDGKPDMYRITPYDVILLEYPFASALDPADGIAKKLDAYFTKTQLALRVPFLRADWVAERLAMKAPLADDIRSLNELATALKKENSPELGKEAKIPCGTPSRAFAGKNPVPAAEKASPARPILPLSAWYTGDCQPDAPQFSLKVEAVDLAGKQLKETNTKTPFRLKVTTDRKIHYVLLMVWADGEAAIQPTKQEGLLEKAGDHFLVPQGKGAFQIPGILTGEAKANEYFVLLASTEKIPMPTVILSRHSRGPDCLDEKRFPVFRFVFDADAKFDQSQVVRKVVAVTVTEKK